MKKVAISQNRIVALLRSMIHSAPVAVALLEIILNWNTYYIGKSTYDQAFYQFVAKTHEVLIQASLSAILFSYIRAQLALGEGLPFGSLFTGLSVSRVSLLWSMEFWGSCQSTSLQVRRKIALLGLISLCIFLATACGPSSAVLLVPRHEFWPAGRTNIWINGSKEDIWPTQVSPDNPCISAGWESFLEYNSLSQHILPGEYADLYAAVESPVGIQFLGKSSQRNLYIGPDTRFPQSAAGATMQHAVVADALTNTGALWYIGLNNVTVSSGHGASLADQSDAIHAIQHDNYQPFVTTYCAMDTIEDSEDTRPLAIPLLQSANDMSLANAQLAQNKRTVPAVTINGVSRRDILDLPDALSEHAIHWLSVE
ncbi:MAG: hypothetical protein Q9222_004953 [Ikaeria aurantiellina]